MFLVASLVCGFAQDMTQLALARVAQGIGSAGLHLMPQTIVGEVTSPRERPRVLSIIGAAFPVAILVGPIAGGLITDAWGWRWVFWINIPVGLIALALAVVAVPHIPGRSGRKFDIAGALALGITVTALVLGASWASAGAAGSGTAVVIAALVVIVGARRVHRDRAPRPPNRSCRSATSRTARSSSAIVLSTVIGVGSVLGRLVRADLHPDGLPHLRDGVGARADRDRVRDAGEHPRDRLALQQVGPLPRVPDLRHRRRRGRLLVMALLPAGMPLWVPMAAMALVGIGTGVVHEHHRRRRAERGAAHRHRQRDRDAQPRAPDRVDDRHRDRRRPDRRGSGRRAARRPRCRDPHAAAVREASDAVQLQVADLYSSVLAPIFIGLAIVYALGSSPRCCCPTDGSRTSSNPAAPATPPKPPSLSLEPDTRRGDAMSHHPTVAIVGSGPIGSAYARAARRGHPRRARRDVRGRAAGDRCPGRERRNIADPDEKERARELSQGPQAGALRESLGIPAGVVVEGMFTARQGTHLIDFGGEGSGHAPTFPAAAASTNVGGMGAHWTCATPSPAFSEKIPFIPDAEWDDLLEIAKDLLHVQSAAFADSAVGEGIRSLLEEEFAGGASGGIRTEHASRRG